MDSSSSDEPIKYAPNRLGIALIAAFDRIGFVRIRDLRHGTLAGDLGLHRNFCVIFHQHCLCAFCAKPHFRSDYPTSNLGLNLFKSHEIFHDGQYGARYVGKAI